jgi:hypothetical protein
VRQVIDKASALIDVLDDDAEETHKLVRLRQFKTNVDGDRYENIFAEKDDEPFVYVNALGARKTVPSYAAVPKPESTTVEKSRKVTPEQLARAILDHEAKLTEWAVAKKLEKGKPAKGVAKPRSTAVYRWTAKDVTPAPAPAKPGAAAPRP